MIAFVVSLFDQRILPELLEYKLVISFAVKARFQIPISSILPFQKNLPPPEPILNGMFAP